MVDASFCGLSERFFANVALRKRVDHSARGDPAIGGVVVCEVKRVEGSWWSSVISISCVSMYISVYGREEVPAYRVGIT
jgi:hypothetical protein